MRSLFSSRWLAVAACAALTSGVASADYKTTVIGSNPSHYWQLEETTVGTVTDSVGSINGTHGGFFGTPEEGLAVLGVPGPQAELNLPGFDGGNLAMNANNFGSVDLGPGAALAASTMTIAGWFKTPFSEGGDRFWTNNQNNGDTQLQVFFGGGSGEIAANIGVGLNSQINGFPAEGLPSGDTVGNFHIPETTVAVKNDVWHHIVVSRNGNNIENVIIVIDGVNYGVETWRDSTDTWGTTSTNAQIATRTPGDGGTSMHAMNGPVDEIAVWLDRQLTVEESIALYRAAVAPGDYNGDNIVDAADYTVWRDGGWVDDTQTGYDVWAANYGANYAVAEGAVPEPTTAALAALALVGLAARRRG